MLKNDPNFKKFQNKILMLQNYMRKNEFKFKPSIVVAEKKERRVIFREDDFVAFFQQEIHYKKLNELFNEFANEENKDNLKPDEFIDICMRS